MIQRCGNLGGARRDQINSPVSFDNGSIFLQLTVFFRPRFERLAFFFRAIELSLGRIAARGVVRASESREQAQDYQYRENYAHLGTNCNGVTPQNFAHSLVNTTRPSSLTER